MSSPSVAVAHDYVTQRGGAERVVLAMLRAFPGAPLYTSMYDGEATYDEFDAVDLRTLAVDRIAFLRRRHRLALPLLAPSFSALRVPAEVVLCSSSGWAHGLRTEGRKVVYCHSPAKWLHQPDRYFAESRPARLATAGLRSMLLRWDRSAALSAHRYLANSTVVRDWVRDAYGVDADVVPPPFTVDVAAPRRPVEGLEPGFLLVVSRLLAYKNVDAVVEAMRQLPGDRLVVVGAGPLEVELRRTAPANVVFLGCVGDDRLRWLYANSRATVSAAHEDFGLTPLEAGAFGKPSVVLRWGGFLDTVAEGATGVFFDDPTPEAVAKAVVELDACRWDPCTIATHVDAFSEARFAARLRTVVAEEAGTPPVATPVAA